jgi:hypothetical protein
MDAEPGARLPGCDALESALTAHFAAQRLGEMSTGYLWAALLPSLPLWLNAWYPLPDLLNWFAVLGWGGCAVLAVGLAVAAGRWRARLRDSLLGAQLVAHVEFSDKPRPPALSRVFVTLAGMASGALWLHGLRPGLLPTAMVGTTVRVWLVFALLAVARRWQEGLA